MNLQPLPAAGTAQAPASHRQPELSTGPRRRPGPAGTARPLPPRQPGQPRPNRPGRFLALAASLAWLAAPGLLPAATPAPAARPAPGTLSIPTPAPARQTRLVTQAIKGSPDTRTWQAWTELADLVASQLEPELPRLLPGLDADLARLVARNLPLPGATCRTDTLPFTTRKRSTVTLDPQASLAACANALAELPDQPDWDTLFPAGTTRLADAASLTRHQRAGSQALLGLQYRLLSAWLTDSPVPGPAIRNYLAVQDQLEARLPRQANLAAATASLAAGLRQEIAWVKELTPGPQAALFVFPAACAGSSEITPLGSAIHAGLGAILARDLPPAAGTQGSTGLAASPGEAAWLLTGHYRRGSSGDLILEYRALTPDRQVQVCQWLVLETTHLPADDWQPFSTREEAIIRTEAPASSALQIELSTSRGRQDLLVRSSDTLTLLVRSNLPVRLWVLDHMLWRGGAQSTLIQQTEDPSGQPGSFILEIPPERTGQWVEFGTYNACPPYGLERLQAQAVTATADSRLPAELLPACHLDPATGLWFVGSDPVATIRQTRGTLGRGLPPGQPAGAAGNPGLTAEAFLTITSQE